MQWYLDLDLNVLSKLSNNALLLPAFIALIPVVVERLKSVTDLNRTNDMRVYTSILKALSILCALMLLWIVLSPVMQEAIRIIPKLVYLRSTIKLIASFVTLMQFYDLFRYSFFDEHAPLKLR
jgi:hypothetical protein